MRKHFILSCLCVVLATAVTAQSTSVPREVGIQLSGINFDGFTPFSAFYKKQKSENVFRRYRFVVGNLGLESTEDDAVFVFNAGFAIGREKRRALDRKLIGYRGPEFSFNLGAGSFGEGFVSIDAGLGYVLGLQHNFNEFWAINIETIPSAGINLRFSEENGSGGLNVGLSNQVSLGVLRRF
jgi:hypothetical protein